MTLLEGKRKRGDGDKDRKWTRRPNILPETTVADKTITLPGSKTVKKGGGQEPTMPMKGRVRVKNVEWKPDVKKFGYSTRAHQNILRPAATIFDDYRYELDDDYVLLKNFIFNI